MTGEFVIKTVTETYVNETDELIHIGVNGETISATPSHPFYVNKFGWTLAGSLKAGDVLVGKNGILSIIVICISVAHTKERKIVNFRKRVLKNDI